MAKWQLFIRHAHRDVLDRSQDNGLSSRGRKQCEALIDYLDQHFESKKLRKLYSSPKIRCVETADYLQRWSGIPIKTDPRLDERAPTESEKAFLKRLNDFCENIKEDCVGIVSHGDVLPELAQILGISIEKLRKGDLFYLEEGQLKAMNPIRG